MTNFAFTRTAAIVVALSVSFARVANAETIGGIAARDYWLDYTRHAHAFADYDPAVPRFTDGSPWWRVKALLMPHRRAQALYLFGDDRLHVFPARVGVIGWGASAGLQF
jgi:hypothetical protein